MNSSFKPRVQRSAGQSHAHHHRTRQQGSGFLAKILCPVEHGFESYISLPIVFSDGSVFGTLCALDVLPKKLENPRNGRDTTRFSLG